MRYVLTAVAAAALSLILAHSLGWADQSRSDDTPAAQRLSLYKYACRDLANRIETDAESPSPAAQTRLAVTQEVYESFYRSLLLQELQRDFPGVVADAE